MLNTITLLLAFKVAILIGEAVYAIFAYIITRQVSLMTETLQTEFTGIFKLLAYIHFYAVIGLLVLSVILL